MTNWRRLRRMLATALALVALGMLPPFALAQEEEATAAVIAGESVARIEALRARADVAAAFRFFQAEETRNLGDLVTLTQIPAPPFGEGPRGEKLAQMLREAGADDVSIDEIGNVIATRRGRAGARGGAPVVAFAAHIDTVFPAETDVSVRNEGNVFSAPGIGDNTRGLVALLSVLRALNAANIQTAGDLLFIGTVGEEGLGDLRGVKHLFSEDGPRIDRLIAIDGGASDAVVAHAIGSHRYRVEFTGPGGHSWGAFGTANPAHALGRAIAVFSEKAAAITAQGPRASFNVGRLGGGASVNAVPSSVWFEVDMRSGEQAQIDALDAALRSAVAEAVEAENAWASLGDPIRAELVAVGQRPAGRGDESASLVQAAFAAIASEGFEPKALASSTDANIAIARGLPAITLSRGGRGGRAHAPDEFWVNENQHVALNVLLLVALAEAGIAER